MVAVRHSGWFLPFSDGRGPLAEFRLKKGRDRARRGVGRGKGHADGARFRRDAEDQCKRLRDIVRPEAVQPGSERRQSHMSRSRLSALPKPRPIAISADSWYVRANPSGSRMNRSGM